MWWNWPVEGSLQPQCEYDSMATPSNKVSPGKGFAARALLERINTRTDFGAVRCRT